MEQGAKSMEHGAKGKGHGAEGMEHGVGSRGHGTGWAHLRIGGHNNSPASSGDLAGKAA